MNRRSFFGMFGALSAVTAAGIILPETVKSYFFMPGSSRVELTMDMIMREASRVLEHDCVFHTQVSRNYDSQFIGQCKVGSNVTLRIPIQYA